MKEKLINPKVDSVEFDKDSETLKVNISGVKRIPINEITVNFNIESTMNDKSFQRKKGIIREAYGRAYDFLEDKIDFSDGSIKISDTKGIGDLLNGIDLYFLDLQTNQLRPSALKNLENNNGWTYIEGEESLPNQESFCFCEVISHQTNYFRDSKNKTTNIGVVDWWSGDETKKKDFLQNFSHYKIIEQSKDLPLW